MPDGKQSEEDRAAAQRQDREKSPRRPGDIVDPPAGPKPLQRGEGPTRPDDAAAERTPYQRVDLAKLRGAPLDLEETTPPPGASRPEGPADALTAALREGRRLRLSVVLPLSVVLCLAQAAVTILAANFRYVYLTSTMIPVLAFGVLFCLVLAVNPLLRLVGRAACVRRRRGRWIPVLSRAELIAVFCAMLVTSGVSTYGLTAQLVPMIGTPWNPEWNTPQAGWDQQVLPHLNRRLYLSDPDEVRVFREGLREFGEGEPATRPPETAGWSRRWRFYGKVFRHLPWGSWLGPLFCWMVFIFACYGAFYSLARIVLGYWSEREKLIFPLAKLPEALVPEPERPARWIPRIFAAPGFWLGFAVSFLVLTWNTNVSAEWIVGLGRIRLGMSCWTLSSILRGSFLEGLGGGRFALLVIFTAIGIAFLLPLEISFSAWFYVLVGRLILLVAVWMGYGRTAADFPAGWIWTNNPVSAQGAGAMLLFSGISLYRSLREYAHLAAGRSRAEKTRLLMPVIGLGICLLVMTIWLSWNRLGFIWSLLVVLFLTLITVGFMRIVAEGGIYWFQSHASFFHSYEMLGLGKIMAPVLVGPLLLIYSVLFIDIKTFMAPNLLNAAKLQKDTGDGRRKFHVNMVVCILVTVVVSLSLAIFLCYLVGAQQMNGWFYSSGPKSFMVAAHRATITPPEFLPKTFLWYMIGAGWLALSMWLRRTLFWFPHPIGYIMLVNPLMLHLWFSFFLGWICKKLVVKYGGKATFDRTRLIFIGLIMGELVAVFLWNILSLVFDFELRGIDLNRYGA